MNRIVKVMTLFAALAGAAFAEVPWHNLYPQYTGLAFGGGHFVAVSEDGAIRVGDGLEWTAQHLRGFPFTAVAYGEHDGTGSFLAVPLHRNLVTAQNPLVDSSSAATAAGWRQIHGTSVTGYRIHHMMHSDDESFVGIGGPGGEAHVWELQYVEGTLPQMTGYLIRRGSGQGNHIARGTERFAMLVGEELVSVRTNQLMQGPVLWAQEGDIEAGVVAYGEGAGFVALALRGGQAYRSPDATAGSWTTVAAPAVPANMRDLWFAGGQTFVAVGNNGTGALSTDGGATWTAATGLNPNDNFVAVRNGNNRFVAVGELGSHYVSADGAVWNKQADGRMMSYRSIVGGGGVFVAVGDSGISRSEDGMVWEPVATTARNLRAVTYGAGAFVAVGLNRAVIRSVDGGLTWTEAFTAGTDSLFAVAFGVLGSGATAQNIFVAGGRTAGGGASIRAIYVSTDGGEEWEDKSAFGVAAFPRADIHVRSLTFGDGDFYLGSSNGVLARSANPSLEAQWQRIDFPPEAGATAAFEGLTFTEGMFIVHTIFGGGSGVWSSTNGTTWTNETPQSNRPPPNIPFNYVTRGKDWIITVGDNGRMYGRPVAGGEWGTLRSATMRNLRTLYFDGEVFLAGGDRGALLYSTSNPEIVSVRHAAPSARSSGARQARVMRMERGRGAPVINFMFTPDRAGTVSVYSLTGRRLYSTRVAANERSVQLPSRLATSGGMIVRYAGGDGTVVSQRFMMVR